MRFLILILLLGASLAFAQNPQPFTLTLIATEIGVSPTAGYPDLIYGKIKFSLTPNDQDAWFPYHTSNGPGAYAGVIWSFIDGYGNTVEPFMHYGASLVELSSVGSSSPFLMVLEGQTGIMEVNFISAAPYNGTFAFRADYMYIAPSRIDALSTNYTRIDLPAGFTTNLIEAKGVPEPSSFFLAAMGLGIAACSRRRQ